MTKKQSKLSTLISSLKKQKGVGIDLDSQTVKIVFNNDNITSISLRDSVWARSIYELGEIENETTDKDIKSIKVH